MRESWGRIVQEREQALRWESVVRLEYSDQGGTAVRDDVLR